MVFCFIFISGVLYFVYNTADFGFFGCRLRTALPKIPVPPMGRDMTLNYEKVVDKNVSW